MNNLLAAGGWSLDIVFFLLLIGGLLFGVKSGFINGICKLAGKIFSVIVSITFCVSFQATLEKWFGTTTALNNAIRAPFGQWIMVVICFIALFLIVFFGAKLFGKIGTWLINKFAPMRIVNMFLGGLLGAFKAFVLIFILLAILRWIPSTSLHEFVSSSGVVSKIFNSEWFINATHISFSFKK